MRINIKKDRKLIYFHLACLPEIDWKFQMKTNRKTFFVTLAVFAICFSFNMTDWSVLAIKSTHVEDKHMSFKFL